MTSPTFRILFHSLLTSILVFACKGNPLELGLTEEAGAMNVMHYFTSPDFVTWTHRGPISWGIASLGLHEQDNQLAVIGIQEVRPPTWYEQLSPKVYGYLFDGETFTATSWSVNDNQTSSYIDPQWFEGDMWYISPTGYTGDPAKAPATPVRSSNPGQTRYEGPRIADPSPVRFNGDLYVFLTQNGAIIQLQGDPLQPVQRTRHTNKHFNGVTVPFATVYNEQLMLVVQKNIGGRRLPAYSLSTDGKTWSSWKPIADVPRQIQACSSPVVGPNPQGGWVMMCIEEKRR